MPKTDRPPLDPRFRPYRVAMYTVYLAVVAVVSTLIILSVVRSVIAMSPRHRAESSTTLSPKECLDRAEQLWDELDRHRRELPLRTPASESDNEWADFRVQWLQRQRSAEAMCAVESRMRASLKKVYRRLDKAMDL